MTFSYDAPNSRYSTTQNDTSINYKAQKSNIKPFENFFGSAIEDVSVNNDDDFRANLAGFFSLMKGALNKALSEYYEFSQDEITSQNEEETLSILNNGTIELSEVSGNFGENYYTITEFNEEKHWIRQVTMTNQESINNILDRKLLEYTQFSPEEIYSLSQLPCDEWALVQSHLEKNPNLDYESLIKNSKID